MARLYGIVPYADLTSSVLNKIVQKEEYLRHTVPEASVDKVIIKWEGNTPAAINNLINLEGPYDKGTLKDLILPDDVSIGNDWNPPEEDTTE